jgi:hypothetical protein
MGEGLDPEVFTSAVGLTASKSAMKGESRPDGRGLYPMSTWARMVVSESDRIDPVINALLDDIWQARDGITSLVIEKGLTAEVICTVIIRGSRPVFELRRGTLMRLAELGYSFVFDVYDYS